MSVSVKVHMSFYTWEKCSVDVYAGTWICVTMYVFACLVTGWCVLEKVQSG